MGLFSSDESKEEPSFSDRWSVSTDNNMQQWEYSVLDLEESADGILASHSQSVGGGEGPSEDLLNQYGKEGWELVDTVESSGKGFGGPNGSKTDLLLFKRPVTYHEKDREGLQSSDQSD